MEERDPTEQMRFRRIREVVEEALSLPASERNRFLVERCAGDARLYREVNALLARDEKAAPLLDGQAAGRVSLSSAPSDDAAWAEFLERLRSRGPGYVRYQDRGEIARGGMGAIRKVFDTDLRRQLALKQILSPGQAPGSSSAASLGRFLEEAQVAGQLDHPGIIPVHELGVDGEGRVYFTMKLVKGEDLRSVIDRVRDPADAEWTETRVLNVLLRVCEAMAYSHSKGVIHRDLKPANVMVGKYGEVYVMDWGLARVLDREDDKDIRLRPVPETSSLTVRSERKDGSERASVSPLMTMDGDVVGTPAYMPPEQAAGRLEEVGPASDGYAVGAMLYHLLTGRMPYVEAGDRIAPHTLLAMVLQAPPRAIHELRSDVPAELVAICDKAMAREVGDRYPDMTALANDLRAYLENRVVQAYETGTWAELKKWTRRNRGLTATAAAAFVVALGLAGWAWLESQDALASATEARENFDLMRTERDRAQSAEEEARQSADLARTRAALVALESGDLAEAARLLPPRREGDIDLERGFLERAIDRSLASWGAHEGGVTGVAWSPDGTRIASCGQDGSVRIWDGVTHAEVSELSGAGSPLRSLAWSNDGARIAAGAEDGSLLVWDAIREEPPESWQVARSALPWVAFDVDGAIWSSDGEGTVRRSLQTGEARIVARRVGRADWPTVLDHGRRRVVYARGDRLLRLDAESNTGSRADFARADDTTCLAIVPAAGSMVSGTRNGRLRLFDVETGALRQSWTIGSGRFGRLAAHPSDALFVSAQDASLELRSAASGEWLGSFAGQVGSITALAFRPDGELLISGAEDGMLRMWETSSARRPALWLDGGRVDAAAFSVDGTRIVLGVTLEPIDAHLVVFVDPVTGRCERSAQIADVVSHVAFSPDGALAASVTRSGDLDVWESAGADLFFQARFDGMPNSLAFSSGGQHLLVGTESAVDVLDARTGLRLKTLSGRGPSSAGPQDCVWIRDSVSESLLRVVIESDDVTALLDGPIVPVTALALSPDGRTVAAHEESGWVRVREVGGSRPDLAIPFDAVEPHLSIEADGRRLVLARKGLVSVVDLETGEVSFTWNVLLGQARENDLLLFDRSFQRAFTSGAHGAELWHADPVDSRAFLRATARSARARSLIARHLITDGPAEARGRILEDQTLSAVVREEALARLDRTDPLWRTWLAHGWKHLDPDRTEVDLLGGARGARQAVLAAPAEAEPRRLLAWLRAHEGSEDEARRQAGLALRLSQGSQGEAFLGALIDALDAVGLDRGDDERSIAERLEEVGEGAALAILRQENETALRAFDPEAESLRMRAERLLATSIQRLTPSERDERRRGRQRLGNGAVRSIRDLEEAARLFPRRSEILGWLGVARAEGGFFETALEDLEQARAAHDDRTSDVERTRVELYRALCLVRLGRRAEAEEARAYLVLPEGEDPFLLDGLRRLDVALAGDP